MEELSRFMQVRQPQTLAREHKKLVGLNLDFGEKHSKFLVKLMKADCDKKKIEKIVKEFVKSKTKQNKVYIAEKDEIDPVLHNILTWISSKSLPITIEEFADFISNLKFSEVNIEREWLIYTDSYILSLIDKEIPISKDINFQLLIQVLYIYRYCIEVKEDQFLAIKNHHLLNEILRMSILLPDKLIIKRCCSSKVSGNLNILPNQAEQPALTASRKQVKVANGKDCECTCNDQCVSPSNHCICINPYIADLFIIREDLHRYEEGDIAHIENILAGEEKVRKHRNLYRTEDTRTDEMESITSEERDNQVSEKFSLKSEVKKTVDSKLGLEAGVSATIKYGPSVTIKPHAEVTANYSKSESKNIARSYAKDLVDRSITKLQEKIKSINVSNVINELEEKNKHSIINSHDGATHRSGLYYWVNKITRAQVFSYGKRMMFDVIIPEPAALYKRLFEIKQKKTAEKIRPVKPELTVDSIDRDNYINVLNGYGVSNAIEPPNENTAIQIGFHLSLTEPGDHTTESRSSSEFKSEQIPDGYEAHEMDYSIGCFIGDDNAQAGNNEASVTVSVGKRTILSESAEKGGLDRTNNWSTSSDGLPMNGEQGVITVSVGAYASLAMELSGTVSIRCRLTKEAYDKWRVKVYNLIMDDFNRKMVSYEATKDNDPLIQITGRNPFLNREVERNELKRHIISLLLCNHFNGIGSMNEKVDPCGYPEIDFEKLERETPLIQFFEQVFEWNYITYLFYHSMWARKCKWAELMDEDSGDPLFDKFLMAGASRVQVPINPGMEEIFQWFLWTGEIWGESGTPPVFGDDNYVSMIQELKEEKQCDFTDRPGNLEVIKGDMKVILKDSTYYYDLLNDQVNSLHIDNDIDREILIDFNIYRILAIESGVDKTEWKISIDKPYSGVNAQYLKHAIGAKYVGAPWEIKLPTKLVYLKNDQDKLPEYPLV